jgi:hypothetical protein
VVQAFSLAVCSCHSAILSILSWSVIQLTLVHSASNSFICFRARAIFDLSLSNGRLLDSKGNVYMKLFHATVERSKLLRLPRTSPYPHCHNWGCAEVYRWRPDVLATKDSSDRFRYLNTHEVFFAFINTTYLSSILVYHAHDNFNTREFGIPSTHIQYVKSCL